MKNKFSNGRLSYFFTPRIHGNVLAWVKPASAPQRGQRVNENILRWEDDGGPVFEIGNSFPPVALRVDQPEKTSEMVKEISKNQFLTKDNPGG